MASFSGNINLMGFKGARVFTNLDEKHPQMAYVCIPVGYYNMTWNDFLRIVHAAMDKPKRHILNIHKPSFQLFGLTMRKQYTAKGIESGIDPVGLADIMCMNTFIDPKYCQAYGVTDDDIKSAIFDSVKLSVDAYKGSQDLIGMRGE